MKKIEETLKILDSQCQLSLFGYDDYFNSFIKSYEKKKLPNVIIFKGQKGMGKSTFVNHFINYILSENEDKNYEIDKFTINNENKSYNLMNTNIHPNFFNLNTSTGETIKIDDVRELIKFLKKTTYSKDIKIVFIDNAHNLNNFSANALLKSLEEPPVNTFFFLIHDSSYKILDTIKSRCIEYNLFFNTKKKKEIFLSLIKQYNISYDSNKIKDFFYYDTPGNVLKYLSLFNNLELDISRNHLSSILYLFDKYQELNDPDIVIVISLFIELFYRDLSTSSQKNINFIMYNKLKILNLLNDMKKYNLDKKNLFIIISNILKNDSK